MYGLELDRSVQRTGVGHIVAASRLQLVIIILFKIIIIIIIVAVTELQGSVSKLTLAIINENVTSSNATGNSTRVLTLPADVSEVIVSDLEPDTFYSAVLTVTVHGGHSITSVPAVTRTSSGGQLFLLEMGNNQYPAGSNRTMQNPGFARTRT